MSTPRVYESNIVELPAHCATCGIIGSVQAKTPWLELHEKEGYVFSHSPKWGGVAVAILPYRDIPAAHGFRREYLAVWESRPCHGGGEYLSSITGAFDNSHKFTMAQCALNELEEEGGYAVGDIKPDYLSWVNGSKSSDSIDHLYAIEITNACEQVECRGDGSKMEENTRPEWVTAEQIINSKDMILITMYCRLLHQSSLK